MDGREGVGSLIVQALPSPKKMSKITYLGTKSAFLNPLKVPIFAYLVLPVGIMLKETLLKFFKLEGLINNLTGYIETRIELVKYELKEDIARAMAKIAIVMVIALFFTLFLLFISITAAYVLAKWVGVYGGFGIIAGVYLALLLVVVFFRDAISHKIESEIKKTLRHKKHQHHEDDGNG